jgi:hypothetical protein
MTQCYQVMTFKLSFLCVIADFRSGINEISALMKRYAAYIGSELPTFRNNLSVPLSCVEQDVSGTVGPFVMRKGGHFGNCRSHCHRSSRTFRNLSVPLSWVEYVSEPVGPFVMGQGGRFGTSYGYHRHGSSVLVFLDCLTHDEGKDRLSRNVGSLLPTYAA